MPANNETRMKPMPYRFSFEIIFRSCLSKFVDLLEQYGSGLRHRQSCFELEPVHFARPQLPGLWLPHLDIEVLSGAGSQMQVELIAGEDRVQCWRSALPDKEL